MGEALVCLCVGGTLDGRSTVGGCARNAYVHEVQVCTSRSGGQCDEVPSLQMSVCSDCHTMAHWYGSQSACLVPCRPRFKSMWGDHALSSLQMVSEVGWIAVRSSEACP